MGEVAQFNRILCTFAAKLNSQNSLNHKYMTTKRKYEKPAMQVFELKQQPQLLQTSGGVPAMPGYPGGGDPFNP